MADRIRTFRAERLGRIGTDETPVPLLPGGRAILHVIPFPPFAGRRDIDVVQALIAGKCIPLPLDGMVGTNQELINLDGFVNYATGDHTHALSYVQFFRNGAIEGVKSLGTDECNEAPYIHGPMLTKAVAFALRQYFDVFSSFGMGLPVFAFLSFTGMDGCTLRHNSGLGHGFNVAGPRRGTTIMLPEITIESTAVTMASALRPAFNALWNAFGIPSCDMYDGKGAWIGDR